MRTSKSRPEVLGHLGTVCLQFKEYEFGHPTVSTFFHPLQYALLNACPHAAYILDLTWTEDRLVLLFPQIRY